MIRVGYFSADEFNAQFRPSNAIQALIIECSKLIPEEYGIFNITNFVEDNDSKKSGTIVFEDKHALQYPCVIEKTKEIKSPIYDEVTYETVEKFFRYDGYNPHENFYNALIECKKYLASKYGEFLHKEENE